MRKRSSLLTAIVVVYIAAVIVTALALSNAKGATVGVTDRLSADHTAIEVTSEPTGTAKIHVAIMANLAGSGVKYLDISAAQLRYTPPIADPVVDVIAETSSGSTIGGWAGRIQTTPSGTPPPPPPPPPPSSMKVGLDIGGWTWASAVKDEAGAVRYVRSSFKHFNTDAAVELLTQNGLTLLPLFGEGGSIAGYDTQTFVNEIVLWFHRYGKGGSFWAGKTDLGATTGELVNEPGNPYFYSDCNGIGGCTATAQREYADLTRKVHAAFVVSFPETIRPKTLVSYDGGFNGSAYGQAIFADGAVADGVDVHPYGGHGSREQSAQGGRKRVTEAHEQTRLPVYVTEVGWPTCGQTGDSLGWTESEQAANIVNWVHWTRSLGYVALTVNFNYADYSGNCYGIVRSSGSPHKLSYAALKGA